MHLFLFIVIGLNDICRVALVIKDSSALELPLIVLNVDFIAVIDEDRWLREQDSILALLLLGYKVGQL